MEIQAEQFQNQGFYQGIPYYYYQPMQYQYYQMVPIYAPTVHESVITSCQTLGQDQKSIDDTVMKTPTVKIEETAEINRNIPEEKPMCLIKPNPVVQWLPPAYTGNNTLASYTQEANKIMFLLNNCPTEMKDQNRLALLQLVESISNNSAIRRSQSLLYNTDENFNPFQNFLSRLKDEDFKAKFSVARPMRKIPKVSKQSATQSSRFHNMTKLLMYNILSMFTKENMRRLQVPELILEQIRKCVVLLKKSAKKVKKNMSKTDFFNHTHYNALFLHLNQKNIEELLQTQSQRDINIHQICYGLDLTSQYIDMEKLEHTNIIKKFAFEIVRNSVNDQNADNKSRTIREEYMEKAMKGIEKLSQGHIIHRFQ